MNQQIPLHRLSELGQSIWLDYISRSLLRSGKLEKLIRSGLRGMTSNPTIFNQAIASCVDYDEDIQSLKSLGKTTFEIYDELTIAEVRDAADLFYPVYKETNGLDGYVSLEINPKLAHTLKEQFEEGCRLFKKLNRPNVMIKVPATLSGLQVVERLLAQGVPVNTTLIFSLEQYEKTAEAYFKGMGQAAKNGKDPHLIHSVASVFVSRLDTVVDQQLDELTRRSTQSDEKRKLTALKGRAAVANCRLIFAKFEELFQSERFFALKKKGASEQRVLWASTGTKNPQYSDIMYVTELIAQPTVNTLPEKTLEAFLDHGIPKKAPMERLKESQDFFIALKSAGIDVAKVLEKLLADGVAAFEKSFDELLQSIEVKSQQLAKR